MEQDKQSRGPRKVRFKPKPPPRRKEKKPDEAIPQVDGDDEDDQALLKRANEHLVRRGPKVETKSSAQVAFGPGSDSSSIRTYGTPREESSSKISSPLLKDSASSDVEMLSSSPTTNDGYSDDEEYVEPWDYEKSYYPTTLPLRRPNSGDPERLDQSEFGDAVTNLEYFEDINPAKELGLQEKNDEPQMLFLQLPPSLPAVKRSMCGKDSANAKGKAIAGSSKGVIGSSVTSDSKESSSLEELPGGYMGKMRVYKSGKIKLELGGILYDVSPGVECNFDQHFVAINTAEKHCCVLGEVGKRAVVTPDVDSLLDPVVDLD